MTNNLLLLKYVLNLVVEAYWSFNLHAALCIRLHYVMVFIDKVVEKAYGSKTNAFTISLSLRFGLAADVNAYRQCLCMLGCHLCATSSHGALWPQLPRILPRRPTFWLPTGWGTFQFCQPFHTCYLTIHSYKLLIHMLDMKLFLY